MNKNISFIPLYKSHLKNEFFSIYSPINRDNSLAPFIDLKNRFGVSGCNLGTYDIIPIKKADYCIFFSLDLLQIIKAFIFGKLKYSLYYQTEPPVVTPLHSVKNMKWLSNIFGKVLTWNDDLVDNIKFFKLYYPISMSEKPELITFPKKKLVTTIVGNKSKNYPDELYSERKKIIEFLQNELKDGFEFYGVGWNRNKYPSYKGKIERKSDVLKHYKFAIAYENQCNLNGLISEKIFDCFAANTIPIYWGAENITDYVPKECFIDRRDFLSNSELFNYISKMTKKEYENKLEAVLSFLKSEKFKKFLPEHFSYIFYEVLINTPVQRYNILKAFFAILRLSLYVHGKRIELILNKVLRRLTDGNNFKKNNK